MNNSISTGCVEIIGEIFLLIRGKDIYLQRIRHDFASWNSNFNL